MWQNNYNYYLYHHGILGQRWGKRNGPPYPLGSSNHSASEKKAGWRKSLDKQGGSSHTKSSNISKGSDNSEKDGFHLTDKQKKALKIGAAAAAASLAAYGADHLAQSGKLNELAAIGKARVDGMLGKETGNDYSGTKNLNNIPLSEKVTESLKSSQSIIGRNPGDYTNNCKDVSLTTCYAHLGHGDLKDNANSFVGNLTAFMEERFENASVKYLTANSSNVQERLTKQILKKCSEGDTGIVGISFDPKFLRANVTETGHAFNFFVESGKVVFKDAQPKQPLSDATKFFKYLDASKEVEWVKIDETLIPKVGALEKSMTRI